MDLTLPTLISSATQDPRFTALHSHIGVARTCAVISIGAYVAAGAEVAVLRDEVQPKTGPRDTTAALVPWSDLVEQQTGLKYEIARRCEKVAIDLSTRLSSKRDKDSLAAKALLRDTRRQFTADEYAVLAKAAGAVYDADTWTGILIETGILRAPVRNALGTSEAPTKIPVAEEARIFALGLIKSLRTVFAHGEKVRQRLAALPLQPTGDPDRPSLAELKAELEDRLAAVKEVIDRKLN
jgi:hypothetical protein